MDSKALVEVTDAEGMEDGLAGTWLRLADQSAESASDMYVRSTISHLSLTTSISQPSIPSMAHYHSQEVITITIINTTISISTTHPCIGQYSCSVVDLHPADRAAEISRKFHRVGRTQADGERSSEVAERAAV